MNNRISSTFSFLVIILHLFLSQYLLAQVQLGSDLEAGLEEVSFSLDGNRMAAFLPVSLNSNRLLRVNELVNGEWVPLGDDIVGSIYNVPLQKTPFALTDDGNRLVMGRVDDDVQSIVTYDWNGENWIQQEATIILVSDVDVYGWSVAISADGLHLAVSSASSDLNGVNSGYAALYEWVGTNWVQLGTDLAGETDGAELGTLISLSYDASRLAITNGNDTVKVFEWNGLIWQQIGQDLHGSKIALSGNGQRLAVADPSANSGNTEGGTSAGQLQVFEWNGTNWEQMGETQYGGYFSFLGYSITLDESGIRLAYATRGHINLNDFGHAGVLQWNADNWIRIGQVMIPGSHRTTVSGVSITSDGGRVALRGRSEGVSTIDEVVRVFDMEAFSFSINPSICGYIAPTRFYFAATPTGGVYSGPGVTDNGDGLSCTIDPSLIEPGYSPVTYTVEDQIGVDSILVYPYLTPIVTFPDTIFVYPEETIPNPIMVEPPGGLFEDSDNYFTYNDDGTMTFDNGSPPAYSTINMSYTLYDPFCPNPVAADVVIVVNQTVAVNDNTSVKLDLFPNPTNGIVYLRGYIPEKTWLLDALGRRIWHTESPISQLDLSHLPNGIYTIVVSISDDQWIRKIIVKQ